jgi:hypothetical protein
MLKVLAVFISGELKVKIFCFVFKVVECSVPLYIKLVGVIRFDKLILAV